MYFLDLSIEKAKKQDSPVAKSTSSAQILTSNTIAHWEEWGLFREMANPRDGQSRYKMNLEYLVMPQSVKTAWRNDAALSQGHSSQFERVPNVQIWDNLSIKLMKYSNEI